MKKTTAPPPIRFEKRYFGSTVIDPIGIRLTGFMEYAPRAHRPHYGLMLAAKITLPHFMVSSAMSLAKSAGEPGSTVAPRLASRAWKLASARLALTCLFSLSMTSSGVRFGAPMPNQIVQPARTSDRARSMLVVGFVKSSMTRPCRLRKVERQLDCDRVLTSNNWGA